LIQEQVTITANREIKPGIQFLTFESSSLSSISHPGQFVMVSCGCGQERLLRRPFSIYNVEESSLSLLFAVVGSGTEWLSKRQKGEKLDILGPLGNGYRLPILPASLLLVAGGLGIAPLNFLAHLAVQQGHQVTLLYGVRTASQLIPPELLPDNIQLLISTEDGSGGEKGLVSSLIPVFANQAERIYACGPLPMYRSISEICSKEIINKPVQISLEVRMGCGLGFCYACTIKTRQGLKQVCKDGPVFNLEDVILEEL